MEHERPIITLADVRTNFKSEDSRRFFAALKAAAEGEHRASYRQKLLARREAKRQNILARVEACRQMQGASA